MCHSLSKTCCLSQQAVVQLACPVGMSLLPSLGSMLGTLSCPDIHCQLDSALTGHLYASTLRWVAWPAYPFWDRGLCLLASLYGRTEALSLLEGNVFLISHVEKLSLQRIMIVAAHIDVRLC